MEGFQAHMDWRARNRIYIPVYLVLKGHARGSDRNNGERHRTLNRLTIELLEIILLIMRMTTRIMPGFQMVKLFSSTRK